MSYMFSNCESLSSLPDISKWNTSNVGGMSYMFSNCELLTSLPDISKWNISSVGYMSYMFSNCKSLVSLPDISNWVPRWHCSFRYAFENCKSLTKRPNIHKICDQLEEVKKKYWSIEKKEYRYYYDNKEGESFSDIFKGCDNLPSDCIIF